MRNLGRSIARAGHGKTQVLMDPDRLAPSSQARLRHIQAQLASLVIAPEMAAQLDIFETLDAVVEECCYAQGAGDDTENFRHCWLSDSGSRQTMGGG